MASRRPLVLVSGMPAELPTTDQLTGIIAPYTAPAGQWQLPSNFVSQGTGSPNSGIAYFVPLDVGPTTKTFDALGLFTATAMVGGTTTSTLGIYPDNGTGGLPNLAAGPIASGAVTLTATGNRTLAAALTLAPGRYWMAFLYVQTAAPTTLAVINTMSVALGLWAGGSTNIGGAARALQSTSTTLTALPTTQIPISMVTGSQGVVIAARAA